MSCEHYAHLEWNVETEVTTENWAIERLLIWLSKSKVEHRIDSILFYDWVKSEPTTSVSEKLRAQERINRLLGLENPAQHHIQVSPEASFVPKPKPEFDHKGFEKVMLELFDDPPFLRS